MIPYVSENFPVDTLGNTSEMPVPKSSKNAILFSHFAKSICNKQKKPADDLQASQD
jgi:hypothetical protein